jgi:hypothetical protein
MDSSRKYPATYVTTVILCGLGALLTTLGRVLSAMTNPEEPDLTWLWYLGLLLAVLWIAALIQLLRRRNIGWWLALGMFSLSLWQRLLVPTGPNPMMLVAAAVWVVGIACLLTPATWRTVGLQTFSHPRVALVMLGSAVAHGAVMWVSGIGEGA